MKYRLIYLLLLSISVLPHSALASEKSATIGNQDEILAEIERELATIDQQNANYWSREPERQKKLINITIKAVNDFKQSNDRYPNTKDSAFIQQVYKTANVKNSRESQLIFMQMDNYISNSKY